MFQFSLSLSEIFRNIFVALICGILVSIFYRWTYRGTSFSNTLMNSLIALSMITSVVIMVIGNNLARAFGLVGAMSIIRFRTAIKDTHDIVFIFFALAVGMASGVGLHLLAFTGTIFIGLIMLVLSKANVVTPQKKQFLLQFTFESTTEEAPYLKVIRDYCKSARLVNVKSHSPERIELAYYVEIKRKELADELVKKLSSLSGVKNINLYFDESSI